MPAATTGTTAEGKPSRNTKSVDFDREMGARLQAVRIATGITQTKLGQAVGVSFRQVQKYETGRDRITAGTLKTIGEVLRVHPGEFFGETSASSANLAELREAMSIAAAMQKIKSAPVRKRLTALIEVLAGKYTAEHDVDLPYDDRV